MSAPWFACLRRWAVCAAPWRRFAGKPDGLLPRLHCLIRGHAWWPCVAECCNRYWCERCLIAGPTLDHEPPRRRFVTRAERGEWAA